MERIRNMAAGVRRLADGGLFAAVRECIDENAAFIVDMNAERQLYERGINRLGVEIMDYMPYHPITVEFKKMKGQPYNRVTLRDEGDFEGSFYVVATDTDFRIRATDVKTAKLTRKYGDEIMGLTDENLNELIQDYVRVAVIAAARQYILNNGKRS